MGATAEPRGQPQLAARAGCGPSGLGPRLSGRREQPAQRRSAARPNRPNAAAPKTHSGIDSSGPRPRLHRSASAAARTPDPRPRRTPGAAEPSGSGVASSASPVIRVSVGTCGSTAAATELRRAPALGKGGQRLGRALVADVPARPVSVQGWPRAAAPARCWPTARTSGVSAVARPRPACSAGIVGARPESSSERRDQHPRPATGGHQAQLDAALDRAVRRPCTASTSKTARSCSGDEFDEPGDPAEGDAAIPDAQPQPGGHALIGAGLHDQVRHRAEEPLRVGDS